MSDIKITWTPRKFATTTRKINDMTIYGGYGWMLTLDGVEACLPKKLITFTGIPAGHELRYIYQTEDLTQSYALLQKLADSTLHVAYSTTPTNWSIFHSVFGLFKQDHSYVLLPRTPSIVYMSNYLGIHKFVWGAPPVVTALFAPNGNNLLQHFSRLLCAGSDDSSSPFASRVAWSVPGNFDDWTGVGSGFTDLSLELGNITGMKLLDNQPVVLGESIVKGYTTGISTIPYRFERVVSYTDRVNPGSIQCWQNLMFWCGRHGVYKYDGRQIINIGRDIFKSISRLASINTPGVWTSMITYNPNMYVDQVTGAWSNVENEPRYLLSSTTGSSEILMYNILKDSWEILTKDPADGAGVILTRIFENIVPWQEGIPGVGVPRFINDTGATAEYFTDNAPTYTQNSLIVSTTFQVGEASKDYTLDRVLFKYSLDVQRSITVYIFYVESNISKTITKTITLQPSNTGGFEKIGQAWLDMDRPVGQFFKIRVDLLGPPVCNFRIIEAEFFFSEAGEFRGTGL